MAAMASLSMKMTIGENIGKCNEKPLQKKAEAVNMQLKAYLYVCNAAEKKPAK
jgi:hypothetical protein